MRRSIVLFPEPMIPDKATSDQFCQYGSKPIPSTVRDATYVLDGILDNETELPIAEHTSDTAGYTDLVFSLFDLLGLQFSPPPARLGRSKALPVRHQHSLSEYWPTRPGHPQAPADHWPLGRYAARGGIAQVGVG